MTTLTDEQKQVFAGLKWTMGFHLNAEDGNTLTHRCGAIGLSKCTFTPKIYPNEQAKKHGVYSGFGTPEVQYSIDGDKRPFSTLAEVANVLLGKEELSVEPPEQSPIRDLTTAAKAYPELREMAERAEGEL